MKINTCKDCPDRYPGCHGKCARYGAAKAEHARKQAEDLKARENTEAICQVQFHSYNKTHKRKQK